MVKLILRVTCLPFQLLRKSYRNSPVTDEDPIGEGEFTGACGLLFYGYYSAATRVIENPEKYPPLALQAQVNQEDLTYCVQVSEVLTMGL